VNTELTRSWTSSVTSTVPRTALWVTRLQRVPAQVPSADSQVAAPAALPASFDVHADHMVAVEAGDHSRHAGADVAAVHGVPLVAEAAAAPGSRR
jgi:hypothetical protein